MKKQLKGFILGVIVTVILMSTVTYSESVKKTIEVVFNSVNITVNGKKVEADNTLYNGTTYVPLRAVAEMLGKEVGWDQAIRTASINDKATVNNKETGNKGIEVQETEIGKITIYKRNENVNVEKKSGPFRVKVKKMQVAEVEPNEDIKYLFDNKDKVTVVTLYIEVENESKNTNAIYPDQGIIVTNTKEQKDAAIFLSDDVGGDYMGEVIKEGNVYFLLDSEASKISSFKYIISAPRDENYKTIGENITFELNN